MRAATAGLGAILCLMAGGCVETSPKASLDGMTATLTGGLVGGRAARQPVVGDTPSPGAAALHAAWVASDLGRQLDDADRRLAAEMDYQVLESGAAGVTREWHGPHSGLRGQVTPGPAYSVNQYTCRDFVDAVAIDGRKETRRSTACRQPDGSWRPIS